MKKSTENQFSPTRFQFFPTQDQFDSTGIQFFSIFNNGTGWNQHENKFGSTNLLKTSLDNAINRFMLHPYKEIKK